MGYYITSNLQGLTISEEHFDVCLRAINELFKDGKEYCWVSGPPEVEWEAHFRSKHIKSDVVVLTHEYPTLDDAFDDWGFIVREEEEALLIVEELDNEKAGDENVLFDAIAPFVTDGAVAQFTGEDGLQWRFVFNEGVCTEEGGTTVFGVEDCKHESTIQVAQDTAICTYCGAFQTPDQKGVWQVPKIFKSE